MDQDLVSALRARGIDVTTAFEKGMICRDDEVIRLLRDLYSQITVPPAVWREVVVEPFGDRVQVNS